MTRRSTLFSQTLQANKMLPALRNALRSADELDADVYFY